MAESENVLERRLGSLRWRNIGPHRGGRVVAVAGHPTAYATFYMGSTGGGVWKTTNGGTSWQNVSDGFFRSASVGALAVAESDPNVLYAGMGECSIRGNVSFGDGVYRSDDGGATWRHLGLEATRHIARVRVHPQDPDTVYAAALGHAFGPNQERGVYRSRDGGRHWDLVLHRNEDAGAVDLTMDPHNPRILYASIWDVRRGAWFLRNGGPGSGLFKSTDGGDTWTELTAAKGLPSGVWGKVGVALSPAREGRVWALVTAKDGGVFRSDDGGATWQKTSEESRLRSRSWYYSHIHADPSDPETVYVLTEGFWKSTDGGSTFFARTTPHGDHHDLWIDPRHGERMIHGADGGATISFDGGRSWSTVFNQPTMEFYHVTLDNRFPYRVYGAQQDNTTVGVASASRQGAITDQDWWDVGGAESGHIAVRSDNPDIVYAGSSGGGEGGRLTRFDQSTGERREVSVWPEQTAGFASTDYKYRFQWTAPIHLSPHDPGVLYSCANHVFRSKDEGESWEMISPDLSRNDPATLGPTGGPIFRDHTGVEVYGTVFALAESPAQRGLIWAGTDDGRVHVTADDGDSWEEVTPSDMPEWTRVCNVEPSPTNASVCYLAGTRYRMDDRSPYLWKTSDRGRTWTRITSGIPSDEYTRCIRIDPEQPGLLFAGTETGIHVSTDDGGHWQRMQLNLPVVPVHDLAIQGGDLVAATHGRGFWILDDITPLRQVVAAADGKGTSPSGGGAGSTSEGIWLFQPRDTVRFRQGGRRRGRPKNAVADYLPGPSRVGGGLSKNLKEWPAEGESPEFLDAGQNPPPGVIVHFGFDVLPEGEVRLTFLDGNGSVIRAFSAEEAADSDNADVGHLDVKEGANRFVWNMRYPGGLGLDDPGQEGIGESLAPWAPPGEYRVRLEAAGRTIEHHFHLVADPRSTATEGDYREQFQLLLDCRVLVTDIHSAVVGMRSLRDDLQGWKMRAEGIGDEAAVREAADRILDRISSLEGALVQVNWQTPNDNLQYAPLLNSQVAHLAGVCGASDHRPTKQMHALFDELKTQADTLLAEWRQLQKDDVAAFVEVITEAGVPALRVR